LYSYYISEKSKDILKKGILILSLLLIHFGLFGQTGAPVKGMTVVAPPHPIGEAEMDELLDVNTEWIALVPFGFSGLNDTNIRFNLERQWWGEKKEGIVKCIQLAHKKGIKVMLKPQVYIHGYWVGDVDFETEAEWSAWEDSYDEYIKFYADIAVEFDVEMFCVGTEYKLAAQKRANYWIGLIEELRVDYSGSLIYSSNWDSYDKVPFWDHLDYIGLSCYFPLSNSNTPAPRQLNKAWRPIKKELSKFAKKYGKKIVFTEFGYMSIDGCAGKAWLIEKDRENRSINQIAQANAYDALFAAHWEEEYWGGGFLWKWFPRGMGHEGYPEKDYTPQGKLSEKVITKWYGK